MAKTTKALPVAEPVPAGSSADDGGIHIEQTGAPRLEGAPAADGATPPDGATAQPGAPLAPRAAWTPEEAAHLEVAAHNLAGIFLYFGHWEKFEAWRAEAREVMDTAPATARSLDRIAPPGVGPIGMLADGLIASEGLVSLIARKAAAVRDADEKPAKPKAKNEPPPTPATAPTPAAARGGAYQHPPELAGILHDADQAAAQRDQRFGG
jgi:hypothetical protein